MKSKTRYVVVDRRDPEFRKEFGSKVACRAWLMDGLFACEGAERDHYVDMLAELEDGKTVLHYN